ncbi:MAG: hypothetical protein HC875_29550 [Anaerolineales bacterium]|nr:hypothetical protein [Anaerolineales bacterium]
MDPNEKVNVLRTNTYSHLSPDSPKFQAARESAVQGLMSGESAEGQYYKQLYGDNWNEDLARKIVMEKEGIYARQKQLTDSKFIPVAATKGSDPPTGFEGQRLPLPAEKNIDRDRFPVIEGPDKVRAVDRLRLADIERGMKLGDNRVFYEQAKNDPQALLDPQGRKVVDPVSGKPVGIRSMGADLVSPNVMSETLIKNRALEDFDGTVKLFDDHFFMEFYKQGIDIRDLDQDELKEAIDETGNAEQKKYLKSLSRDYDRVNKYIEEVNKRFDIDGPAFQSLNEAIEATHIYESTRDNPEYNWSMFEEADFLEDYDKLNKAQKNQLTKTTNKWQAEELGKVTYPCDAF